MHNSALKMPQHRMCFVLAQYTEPTECGPLSLTRFLLGSKQIPSQMNKNKSIVYLYLQNQITLHYEMNIKLALGP